MMGFSIAFIIIVLIVLYSLARTAGESDRILENIREQSLLGREESLLILNVAESKKETSIDSRLELMDCSKRAYFQKIFNEMLDSAEMLVS